MDDVRAWQQRPLEDVYPVVFLDCLVLKIREGGSVQRRACYLALGRHRRGRARRARDVVSGDRGREVLDAGPHRAQAARRPGHPDLLRRRAQGLPRGDRGDLPPDRRADVHRAPHPPQPALRARGASASRSPATSSRSTPPSTPTPPSTRSRRFDEKWGAAVPGDHPGVAERVGVRDPVPGVSRPRSVA